ncbi:hypothetical protein [Streptomyces sp. NPDC048603]|uniref:hypothetical protein n=1 Tax=Streptomyces sp. NPDC048603 TaxID=3365577 RepID=UPI003714FDC5
MRDSFGIEIEDGDYILSASTTHGRVKVGTAFRGRTGNLSMRVDLSAQHGQQEAEHPRSGQLGYNVVVLRKADGTVPAHISETLPSGDILRYLGETREVEEAELVDPGDEYWTYRVWVRRPEDARG